MEVICDNNAEGEQDSMFWGAPQDESTSLEPALLSSTLAALTGGRLYGAEKTVQEEKEGQWPSSAAEVQLNVFPIPREAGVFLWIGEAWVEVPLCLLLNCNSTFLFLHRLSNQGQLQYILKLHT